MSLGKFFILGGVTLIVVGVLLTLGSKLPWVLGRLPGDILIQRERFTFSFPIVTCLILSLLLTLIINLFFKR